MANFDLPIIAKEYSPYDKLPEFQQGFDDYILGIHVCPDYPKGYQGQAWDRGHECASRCRRWRDQNVGD